MAHRIARSFAAALAVGIVATASPAYAMPFLLAAPLLATLATAVIGSIISIGLSFVMKALTNKTPSTPAMDISVNNYNGTISVRQPAAPRQIVYGEQRVGGNYAFMSLTNSNQTLSIALMLAGHQVEEIKDPMIADEQTILDGEGRVTNGKFARVSIFAKHNGTDDQAADVLLMNTNPGVWTQDHKLSGIAYLAGQLFWDNTTGTGNPNQGTFQVLQLGQKIWSGGLPNFTAVVKGKLCYDPRTGETAYTTNSALIVADFLCDQTFGFQADYAAAIREDLLIAAANICDEQCEKEDGTFENRYETNYNFKSDQARDETLGRLLGAMQGRATYDGEQWLIFAGAWLEPTDTLTDDEMRAPSTVTTLASSADSFNGVKGTYIDPTQNYQPVDFPAIVSQTFRAEDGGEERWNDISLNATQSPSMAQRIAKIQLLEMRQEVAEVFHGMLSCWRFLAGTTLRRTSARWGWDEKRFFVDTVKLVFEQDENGSPVVGIDLALKETDPSIFDWSTSEEQAVDPAPNSNLGNVFEVAAPANVRANEFMFVALNAAGVQSGVKVEWDRPDDALVRNGGYYRIKYRLATEELWTLAPQTTFISAEIRNLTPGSYLFEVEAVNWADTPSEAVRITVQVVGLSAKPAAPDAFSVVANDTVGRARWDLVDDLDVSEGGYYVMRHSPVTDGSATWTTAYSLGDDIPGKTNSVLVPLLTGTYLLKARDSSGNYSVGVASYPQFQTSVHQFALVTGGSTIFDPDFAGVRTNAVVVSDVLRLDAEGNFDEVVDVDSLPSWDSAYGIEAVGDVEYETIMELSARKLVRLTNVVEVGVENVFDDFDYRTSESDTWDQWDGDATGNEADTWLEVEWTVDDPGPGRTWFGPERLHSSSYDMKAARFRRELRSHDSSYTVAVFSDAVYAEEVVI